MNAISKIQEARDAIRAAGQTPNEDLRWQDVEAACSLINEAQRLLLGTMQGCKYTKDDPVIESFHGYMVNNHYLPEVLSSRVRMLRREHEHKLGEAWQTQFTADVIARIEAGEIKEDFPREISNDMYRYLDYSKRSEIMIAHRNMPIQAAMIAAKKPRKSTKAAQEAAQ